ncbi:unnamed protein product, partial [Gordionus sp. m RMFG-2023]
VFLQPLKEFPPPVKQETRAERRERKRREKIEQMAYVIEQGIALWNPLNNTRSTQDPYRTLFVARINFDTSESKLKKEFSEFGAIKKIYLIHNKINGKPLGYAFVEYDHERDMHAAYKRADGRKIDGRRVIVDVERGRTIKGWLPRRFGGGLGNSRKGPNDAITPETASRHGSREKDKDRHRASSHSKRKRSRSRSRSREKRKHDPIPKKEHNGSPEIKKEKLDGEQVDLKKVKKEKKNKRSRSKENKKRRSRSKEKDRSKKDRHRDKDRSSKKLVSDDSKQSTLPLQPNDIKKEKMDPGYDKYIGNDFVFNNSNDQPQDISEQNNNEMDSLERYYYNTNEENGDNTDVTMNDNIVEQQNKINQIY